MLGTLARCSNCYELSFETLKTRETFAVDGRSYRRRRCRCSPSSSSSRVAFILLKNLRLVIVFYGRRCCLQVLHRVCSVSHKSNNNRAGPEIIIIEFNSKHTRKRVRSSSSSYENSQNQNRIPESACVRQRTRQSETERERESEIVRKSTFYFVFAFAFFTFCCF